MEFCPYCNSEIEFIERPDTPHHGELRCSNSNCGRWLKWVSNPKQVRGRKNSIINSFKKIESNEFCSFCLREKLELGTNETLTVDHIQPRKYSGLDNHSNFRYLCSACHKLRNWTQLYLNEHLKKFYVRKKENDTKPVEEEGL